MILITGGAGFIGSNFALEWIKDPILQGEGIVNIDKLTYAGNPDNLASLRDDNRHIFIKGDICDRELINRLIEEHKPRAIVHFAAESHVDRSIHGPSDFLRTNIEGTFVLLEAARNYWNKLSTADKSQFRFLHVSTDEVYGSLESESPAFTEENSYKPNSPYSATKAASDHLVRSWHHTFGLPVVTTNCSNNYGPYQFPEKLIPLMIVNALSGKPLPIYGDGKQIRDWLYVIDHCSAIRTALNCGRPGQTYNIGGGNEKTNVEIVQTICRLLDQLQPRVDGNSYLAQVVFVSDRPGHDRRYAINAKKIKLELGWRPVETFDTGILKTVKWYLSNSNWTARIQGGLYRAWIKKAYESGK
jgi:dTDP-glucose 4,6-dehydratase